MKNVKKIFQLMLCIITLSTQSIFFTQAIYAVDQQNGWLQEGEKWRYYEDGNFVANDWRELFYNGEMCNFHFDVNGYMQTGWQWVKFYDETAAFYCWAFFYDDGVMATSTIMDDGTVIRENGTALRDVCTLPDGTRKNAFWCDSCKKVTPAGRIATQCPECKGLRKKKCIYGCNITGHNYCRACGKISGNCDCNFSESNITDVPMVFSADEDEYCGNCGTRLYLHKERMLFQLHVAHGGLIIK